MSRAPADEAIVKAQIQSFEDEFFDSVTAGEEALQKFSCRWAEFARSVSSASYSPGIMQLLHRVSLTIGMLCESLLSLEQAAQEIQQDFEAEIEAILDRSRPTDPSKSFPAAVSMKRDVSLAARWLSRNYHNPYPSSVIRDDISKRANWARKDVDSWFTEARKKIGWNKIRKDFFSNKRADTVQAATVFFGGCSHSLQPALQSALVAMAMQAKELYVEPFQPDNVDLASEIQSSQNSSVDAGQKYISRSTISRGPVTPPQSLSPPLRVFSPVSNSVSPSPSSAKRPRSEDFSPAPECSKLIKRPRYVESGSMTSFSVQLPSPAASHTEVADHDLHPVREPLFTQSGRFPSPPALPAQECRRGLIRDISDIDDSSELLTRGSCEVTQSRAAILPRSSSRSQKTIIPDDDGYSSTSLSKITPTLCRVNDATQWQILNPVPSTISALDVQGLLSRAEIPEFSFDFPGSATCENSIARQVVDLALFDASNSELHSPVACTNDLLTGSGSTDSAPYANLFGNTEIASLSTLFGNYISENRSPVLDPLQFGQETISLPPGSPSDFPGIEANFNSLLGFDPNSAFCLSDAHAADTFPNHDLESCPSRMVPTVSKNDSQLAQLDALRKHQARIQKQIQLLECQISDST